MVVFLCVYSGVRGQELETTVKQRQTYVSCFSEMVYTSSAFLFFSHLFSALLVVARLSWSGHSCSLFFSFVQGFSRSRCHKIAKRVDTWGGAP